MNSSRHTLAVALVTTVATTLVLAACASSPESQPAVAVASTSADTAAVELSGAYPFVLVESDVYAGLKSKCAAESAGDAAKAQACVAAVAAEAAKEGVRFEKDAQGRVTWISYGDDEGKPVVYHQVPIALTSDGAKGATGRTLGPATGVHAQKRPIVEGTVMRFELVDAQTLAMNDPKKGRLVFRRASK